MADEAEEREALEELRQTGEAIGRLAKDEATFRAAVDAFHAQDPESFHGILGRLELLPRCRFICHWLCSKWCVLVCLDLCGPPREEELPDFPEFLRVVADITADEELVEDLAGAIEERDAEAFGKLIKERQLERFCHLLCHWVCGVRCRLICDVVCPPGPARPPHIVGVPHLVGELRRAGQSARELLEQPELLKAFTEAGRLGICDIVRGPLAGAGFEGRCAWVCELLCSWRCVRVCVWLCRAFPLPTPASEIGEMREFAQVSARLAEQGALEKLSAAVGAGDRDAFGSIIKEFQLERYCIQVCHWVCSVRCRIFCRCVCRPVQRPWFTHVGDFHIYADIDSGTGRTNKAMLGHGGPDYGFFSCLELRGFCPQGSPDPSHLGEAMAYRFVYELGGARTPITAGLVCDKIVGSRQILWDSDGTGLKPTFQTIIISGVPQPPPPSGPPAPPPPHVINPDADGWVIVDPLALGGAFNGALMGFASPAAVPGGAANPGVAAGVEVTANQRNGEVVSIVFEATRVSTLPTTTPDFSNSLPRCHINNWDEARLLDILQFHSGGGDPCSPLSTDLDIEYTVDHELIAEWFVTIETAASIPSLTLPPISNPPAENVTPRGGYGTHHEDISTWPSCSYAVRLHTRRRLTTGLIDDPERFLPEKTFCIGRKREKNG
jgi:hypothetical protein